MEKFSYPYATQATPMQEPGTEPMSPVSTTYMALQDASSLCTAIEQMREALLGPHPIEGIGSNAKEPAGSLNRLQDMSETVRRRIRTANHDIDAIMRALA